jgi:CBS domain-containing protein
MRRMRIRELMTTSVITCSPTDTCTDAARRLKTENVGSLPVVEGGKLAGIVTDRDIILHCVAEGKSCDSTPVSDCMTRNPVTCTPDMDAHDATRLMASEQVRRLPVVDNGRLVGICSLGDLAVVDVHVDEAGQALSGISEQTAVH